MHVKNNLRVLLLIIHCQVFDFRTQTNEFTNETSHLHVMADALISLRKM